MVLPVAPDARDIEVDACADQTIGTGVDVPIAQIDLRAKLFHRFHVQVHRTRAPGTATGERDACTAEPGEERTEHIDRRPHLLDMLVGRFEDVHTGGVEREEVVLQLGGHSHRPQERGHGVHVAQRGCVPEMECAAGQQGGGHQCECRVLGAADADGAVEGLSAPDHEFIHRVFNGTEY